METRTGPTNEPKVLRIERSMDNDWEFDKPIPYQVIDIYLNDEPVAYIEQKVTCSVYEGAYPNNSLVGQYRSFRKAMNHAIKLTGFSENWP
jgi:hypothetical protein